MTSGTENSHISGLLSDLENLIEFDKTVPMELTTMNPRTTRVLRTLAPIPTIPSQSTSSTMANLHETEEGLSMIPEPSFLLFGGIIILCISLTGAIGNSYILISVIKKKNPSSFFVLCGTKAFYNIFISFVFLLFSVPTTFIQPSYDISWVTVINRVVGAAIGGPFYLGGVLVQVVASVNRVIACFSVRYYQKFCSVKASLIASLVCFVVILVVIVFCAIVGIEYYFHFEYLVWTGAKGIVLEASGILVYICTLFMFICNLITFAKLVNDTVKNRGISESETTKRMKRNRILFAQKLMQDCLYLVDMLFSQFLVEIMPFESWYIFLCLTIVWLSMNAIDGLIMIVFTKDLMDPIKHRFNQIFPFLSQSSTRKATIITVSSSAQ